jgi:uncharacterized repeat protein (TIGR01451 family)
MTVTKAVNFLQPAPGAIFPQGATITLQAQADNPNAILSDMEYYDGSTKLGETGFPPYAITWTQPAFGKHWLLAIATDNSGQVEISAPLEITIVGPDCPSASSTNAPASNPGSPPQPSVPATPPLPDVYFGQDVSPYPPFGPNQVARPTSIINSERAATTFLARLPGVATETFESFAPGSVPTQLTFGTNVVSLSGGQAIVQVADPNGTIEGEFPISGSQGLELVGNSGTGFFGLDFTTPQAAFGFYATDIELNGLEVTLFYPDGSTNVLVVPVTLPQGSGGALFYGVIDRQHPFQRVELSRTGTLEDGFLFDNLTIATPEQVLPDFAWPTVSIADAPAIAQQPNTPTAAVFPITLQPAAAQEVSVAYLTLDESAHAGSDYMATNGVIAFAPGQTNADITVQILPGTATQTNRTLQLQLSSPTNAVLGRCTASAVIVRSVISLLSVNLTTPEDHTVFCPGTDIPIIATAQTSLPVDHIEFYAGTTLIGETNTNPSGIIWNRTNVITGDYVLTAKVFDTAGNTAVSAPVRIAVSGVCGDVAIVRNFPDPEIDALKADLFEIGLSAQVFDREGLSFEMLAPFQTIIWDDLGSQTPGLSDSMVNVLQRTQTNGAALYLIGEQLAASGANLSPGARTIWTQLAHIAEATNSNCAGLVQVQSSVIVNPILTGRFGTVTDFSVGSVPDSGKATGTDAEVFGQCGNIDVLIGYPGLEAVDQGQPRVFTQNVRVATGSDGASLAQRKALFQNVLCWLHHCECTLFDVGLQASGPVGPLELGAEVDYNLLISQTGECEATGAVVTDTLPAGVQFVRAVSEQGICTFDPVQNAVICDLGHLAQASITQVTVVGTAQLPGTWTNSASVHINAEVRTNNNFAQVITVVQGTTGKLSIGPAAAGQLQLTLSTSNTGVYTIQTATDLRNWSTWQTNVTGAGWSKLLQPSGMSRFFRLIP